MGTSNGKAQVTAMALADERQYYAERLDDPSLLERAVDLGDDELAVPCGGKRVAGFVCVRNRRQGRWLVSKLQQLDGFPNVRFVAGGRDYAANVCWGVDVLDVVGEAEVGRRYGYSDAAIARYCTIPRDF
jgi:hypothetical protein